MANAFESPFLGRALDAQVTNPNIALLLELGWWDWPIERIRAALPLLTSGDVRALHAFWREFDVVEPTDA